MATITLEVPDELAQRLADLGNQLPELLFAAMNREELQGPSGFDLQSRPWREAIRFLLGMNDKSEILNYYIPDDLQDRVEELLFLNSEGEITEEELAELEAFLQVNQFFSLLKSGMRAGIK
jgi:hypothetical protein